MSIELPDWSELEACAGHSTATHVPEAIEQLFSPSSSIRKEAYWKIDNYVVVQGTLYESAPYAARLIVDRVLASPDKLNDQVLDILFELASGASSSTVQHGPLAGHPIKELCRSIVAESLPVLKACKSIGLLQKIEDVLGSYAEADVGAQEKVVRQDGEKRDE